MRVTATLELHGKTATGIEIPGDVVEALGAGRRPPVVVTVNGHRYRSSIAFMGGRFLLGLSAEVRAAAGVSAGDEIVVDLERDDEPREVEVPADLSAALDAAPTARAAFDALSYSGKRRIVLAIDAAKTAETRERRIASSVNELGG